MMATTKRDRQRVNRATKQASDAKKSRRRKILVRGRRLLIWAVLILVALLIASALTGSLDAAALSQLPR